MKDYIDITLLVDRSSSMASIHKDVIGGLNTFVEEQRKLPGKATINIYQFDDKYDMVLENMDINNVQKFTDQDFSPRGTTNLYDAIGRTILSRGRYYAGLKEEDRPEKVIIVIFTDGFHNCNGEFTRQQVFDMVKHQEEVYSWEIIYLGADQDAMEEGGSVGISSTKTMSFDKNAMHFACTQASSYTSKYRSGEGGW